jgi:hypothetical protein
MARREARWPEFEAAAIVVAVARGLTRGRRIGPLL